MSKERTQESEEIHSFEDIPEASASSLSEENSVVSDLTASRKAYFKNITIESYKKKEGKRNYKKTQYCLFCITNLNSRVRTHLMSVHMNEERVSKILELPLRSFERKSAWKKIQNEGNYEHNLKVLKNGKGTLVVYRRPTETSPVHPSQYIPCEYCYGFYQEKHLWEHAKSCSSRNVEVDSPSNYVRNGRLMLLPFFNREENQVEELDTVINKMKETSKNPGLKELCEGDELIREFGISLLDKLGTPEEQRRKDQDNIRTKMRSVAKLLKKLNEEKLVHLPLNSFICAREFKNVVTAVKELSRSSDSPNFALTLGHYIKQIALLKASLGLQNENHRQKQEAKDFQDLYAAHWNSKVASVANRTKRLRCMNKPEEIPSTEDLITLKNYLVQEIKEGLKARKPTYEHYVKMTQVITARIVLFNKRRISEVDELKMLDFENRIKGEQAGTNTEILNSLEISERALLKRMELVEVRGKSTRGLRKVYILLTPDMVEGISYLLCTRIYAGINPENPFVFARTSSTPQDGCFAMRMVSDACPGLSNPKLIRTRLLRKYLATTSQIMDMTGEELKLVADHMGHSVAIHTDIYKLQSSVLERTKVARALIALENGALTRFKGKSLTSINLDELPAPVEGEEIENATDSEDIDQIEDNITEEVAVSATTINKENSNQTKSKVVKRKRWSTSEENSLREAFRKQITDKRNASTEEIRKAKLQFGHLKERSEAVIRVKLNNIILGKCKF